MSDIVEDTLEPCDDVANDGNEWPGAEDFPGDLGFDPLGFSSDGFISQVSQIFGGDFNVKRWYREAELMHGRAAMLATFNVVIRETPFTGFMPETQVERNALVNLIQFMTILEGVRGWRLLVDQDRIAGDLDIGSGLDRKRGELAEKTYKELQNGRLAMLAFVGISAQWSVTGRAVGIDVSSVVDYLYAPPVNDQLIRSVVLSVAGLAMLVDGVRRLSSNSSASSSIAAKAINPMKIATGVQDPRVSLPAGVVAGQPPQTLHISEQQVAQFEEDGVIMVKGGLKEWVPYLQAITDHQIENPHVWSLVGRISGLSDSETCG
ncbi:unnamed protein product [Prorocentrum cordatum]|uniref:Fucoxanthin-chlorophyll a/c light-harvesting protein n=1 Tax=Prorocentrum cordatum TaxID=2364126 RepID=A0ABN9U5I7_9DINO|nr:unnamed protein product [Polarella glacialis]